MEIRCGACGRHGHARTNSKCPYYGSAPKSDEGGEVVLSSILLSLLDTVKSMPGSSLFLQPVSETEAPDYYDIIKDPMDFSTIRDKVTKMVYKSRKEFRGDVCQMVLNAHKYNAIRHPQIPPLADELLDLCDCLLVGQEKSVADIVVGKDILKGTAGKAPAKARASSSGGELKKRKADDALRTPANDALRTPASAKGKVASSDDGGEYSFVIPSDFLKGAVVVRPPSEPLMRKLLLPAEKERLDSIPPAQVADEAATLAFMLLQQSLHFRNYILSAESQAQEARKAKLKDLEMLAEAKAEAQRAEAKVKALEARLR